MITSIGPKSWLLLQENTHQRCKSDYQRRTEVVAFHPVGMAHLLLGPAEAALACGYRFWMELIHRVNQYTFFACPGSRAAAQRANNSLRCFVLGLCCQCSDGPACTAASRAVHNNMSFWFWVGLYWPQMNGIEIQSRFGVFIAMADFKSF